MPPEPSEPTPLIDLGLLRSWVGNEETRTEPLTAALVERFHATLDMPGEPAVAAGMIAPRLIHFCLGQAAVRSDALGRDGHPATGGFLPPVPLPKRMWAGGRLRFHAELHVGDVVRRTSRIADVRLTEGRTGTLFCFVTVEHRIEAAGALAIEVTQELVYRDAAAPAPPRGAPAPQGETCHAVDCGATRLFRYSAITFNGHRIHYDRQYATEVEGYPGLVVHGPLQATLLLQLAARLRGALPTEFTFRSQSPLFDGRPVLLNAKVEGAVIHLWTAAPDGPVAMSAQARFAPG